MTPQEALEQALRQLDWPQNQPTGGLAAAILDALPEGWALLNAEGAILLTKATLAKGAQQERRSQWLQTRRNHETRP